MKRVGEYMDINRFIDDPNSIAIKVSELERKNTRDYLTHNDAYWLISTLRQKMAECEELKRELKGV